MGKNGDIEIEKTEGTSDILSAKENRIKIKVTSFPFTLRASGFDLNRDLKVRLTRGVAE